MIARTHASRRAQQRCIPPLVDQLLDQFDDEQFDGHGGVIRYFSRASIRTMEREFGRAPVRKLSEYLSAYKVESSRDGQAITYGHRIKHIRRK